MSATPTEQTKIYNRIRNISQDFGITTILPPNINEHYKNIDQKCKSLANGYIRSEGKSLTNYYTIFSNIPIPIYETITLFYTSFKSKELYIKQGEKKNDKPIGINKRYVVNFFGYYFPDWKKGWNSLHGPTHTISINNVHILLALKTDNDNILDIPTFNQLANRGIITLIYNKINDAIFNETSVNNIDIELVIKCLQILKFMSSAGSWYRSNSIGSTYDEVLLGHCGLLIRIILPLESCHNSPFSFIIKKELFEILSNYCNTDNVSIFINNFLPQFTKIWKMDEDEYKKSLNDEDEDNYVFSGLACSEYNNYNNSKTKYFQYLIKAMFSIERMTWIGNNAPDSCYSEGNPFLKTCEIVDENNNNIFKYMSFVLNICKNELLLSNKYENEIIEIYKYICQIFLNFIKSNKKRNKNLTNLINEMDNENIINHIVYILKSKQSLSFSVEIKGEIYNAFKDIVYDNNASSIEA